MTHLLIIGGSDAGISAALRAKELDPNIDVTVVVADSFPNYSICGLPFFLSGEVPDWHDLAHRTEVELKQAGIRLLLDHTAQQIHPTQKIVQLSEPTERSLSFHYDRLIIATGAISARPKIEGLDLPGVYFLRSMMDSFGIYQHLMQENPTSATIIGGGYVGLEMADALHRRGLEVTVVEHSETVLKTVDASMAWLVGAELQRHRVDVVTGVKVETICTCGNKLILTGSSHFQHTTDLVIVATGVEPVTEIAQTARLELGVRGAIRVDRKMETNVSGIYAAGDCAETYHRILDQAVYLPLGTTAHKQGRIAGSNAAGFPQEFAGSLGTQVVKVFDLAIARTGLRDAEAISAGFQPKTVEIEAWDHKTYYPGAHRLHIRLTGDAQTQRLLGAQIVGHHQAEVAKRIDIFATALFHEMTIAQISDLDLSYTPPLSSPWDAVQAASQVWEQSISGFS